jgi:hypothetical protein
MDAESGERVTLAEIAERCRDEPMAMAEIIERAAELLREFSLRDGETMYARSTFQNQAWDEKRDQWLRDAGFKGVK